jgi:hypothetical protein
MADDSVSPFDDDDNATQLLQGLISPVPAQALVAPPPDTPPNSGPGESTPLTGSLAAAPSQATPKVNPAALPASMPATGMATGTASAILASAGQPPKYDAALAAQLEQTRNADATPINPYADQYRPDLGTKIRRGLAGYFSGGIGGALRTDYSAPNGRYATDEAAREGRLAQDDANLANFNKGYDQNVKGYQQALDQAKNAILLQRSDQLQQARQQSAGIRQQNADARQEDADTQQKLAQIKARNAAQQKSSAQPVAAATPQSDSGYVKVLSNGQVGYLPKANLEKAQQRDKNLKVLE